MDALGHHGKTSETERWWMRRVQRSAGQTTPPAQGLHTTTPPFGFESSATCHWSRPNHLDFTLQTGVLSPNLHCIGLNAACPRYAKTHEYRTTAVAFGRRNDLTIGDVNYPPLDPAGIAFRTHAQKCIGIKLRQTAPVELDPPRGILISPILVVSVAPSVAGRLGFSDSIWYACSTTKTPTKIPHLRTRPRRQPSRETVGVH